MFKYQEIESTTNKMGKGINNSFFGFRRNLSFERRLLRSATMTDFCNRQKIG